MKFKDNTIRAVYDYFSLQLHSLYPENEVRKLARMILEDRLGYDQIQLSAQPGKRLSESEMLTLIRDVKELKKGRPVQYILGVAHFLDLELNVNENVLIPRPETEELVKWILSENRVENVQILDIGTGSGCIALSLKKSMMDSDVWGMDISKEALDIATSNARHFDLEVAFFHGDILAPSQELKNKKWDIIVSNPPYIQYKDKHSLHINVAENEPASALFVPDEDSLLFYRHIAHYAKQNLNKQGRLYFEINEKLGREIQDLLKAQEFKDIRLKKDLNGKDRMLAASM